MSRAQGGLYPILFLTVVVLISVIALTVTNGITEEPIAEGRHQAIMEMLQTLFPEMDDFSYDEESGRYTVTAGGTSLGQAFMAQGVGYGGPIDILIGLEPDGALRGVQIVSQKETPGLGAKIVDAAFLDQFVGADGKTLALTKDGSKVLLVVLDESGGTRSGHDLLYADTNFNGRFEESERLAADKVKRYGKWLSSSSFPSISLDAPFNEKGKAIANPCEVTLGYRLYPKAGVPEDVFVQAKVRLRERDDLWEYTIKGNLLPAKTLSKAPVSGLHCTPSLEITTRPDERKKGNMGIGLELIAGEHEIKCSKGGKPVQAHVEIKMPDGKVVHRGDATLDKFAFG